MVDHVSKGRASLDFLAYWQNTLLLSGLGVYAAKRFILPLMGKSAESFPYLSKMNAAFIDYWAFADLANVVGGVYLIGRDISAEMSGLDPDAIRHGEAGRAPNEEYHLQNTGKWLGYRIAETALKVFSSAVLVHAGLESAGVLKSGPSTAIRAAGAGAGMVGFGMEIFEIEKRKGDYRADPLYNHLVKGVVNPGVVEQAEYDEAYLNNLFWTQMFKGCIIGIKTIGLISAISKCDSQGMVGRVQPLAGRVMNHSVDLYNGVFVLLAGSLYIQKVKWGANLNKWNKEESTWFSKFTFKQFPDSREFIRIFEASATTLTDFGVDVISELFDVDVFGKFAKSLDSFLYIPKVVEGTGKVIDRGWKLGFNKKSVWDFSLTSTKLAGDVFASLKYIGGFGGVAYLSDRVKGFGHLKNGFKSAAAVATITQEIFFPEKRKDGNPKTKSERAISIVASVGSLFLNGFGGLSSAFGKMITPPAPQNFKPWVYNVTKLYSTSCAALGRYLGS